MRCAHKQNQDGFTLVEISIVMIIIGLLIGGTFSGMKLIESAKVTKAASDLKAFDSGGLTFRDAYGRLPGDLRNPSTRLPNCAALPCSTAGNGDRKVGGDWDAAAITTTDEEFTFWQHLLAAGLISNVKPVADLAFEKANLKVLWIAAAIGWLGIQALGVCKPPESTNFGISEKNSAAFAGSFDPIQDSIGCEQARSLDSKIDDGRPVSGKLTAYGNCSASAALNSDWTVGGTVGAVLYRLAF